MGRGAPPLLLAFILFLTLHSTPASAETKTYLVVSQDPVSILSVLISGLTTNFKTLYVFPEINAIGVQIDDSWVPALRNLLRVVAVIPDRLHKFHTTHSWDYLGLTDGLKWNAATLGEGVIIGHVDTGVSPASRSFRDDGMSAPAWRRWRGGCNPGKDPTFRCNNKLIGAKFFNAGIQAPNFVGVEDQPLNQTDLNSARDYVGHGSHTLSTSGGRLVPDVSVFGHGKGTAKGGSPGSWVASYKACYAPGCAGMDILEAIFAAVEDGVQVLSLSLGADATDYVADLMAIGTLYAVLNGVTVVCAGGNSGPQPGSVSNVAPWILTVGASTMDRDFPAEVTFGSSTIKGQSLSSSTEPASQQFPMISGEKANLIDQSSVNSTLCLNGTLDPAKVSGKIVVCTRGINGRVEKGLVVKQAGGIGMVLCNDLANGDGIIADPHLIPAAHCSFSQCKDLFTYLQNTQSPVGNITAKDAQLGVKPSPVMASFSSRGPNTITPQILKPDITAPGVSVIAAYPEEISATGLDFDPRHVPFNIMSGTSMACPHVAGVAGLVKAKYPGWSPAMVKSAIMTTASTGANDNGQIRDETGAAATPFSCGSGQLNPVKALDPGLVYDTTLLDYANFLCSVRPTQIQNFLPVSLPFLFPLFIGLNTNPFKCSLGVSYRPENLNYPSISATCFNGSTTVKRRLTNVGSAPYLPYNVSIVQPTAGVRITVVPSTLSFSKINEEKEFTVKLDVDDDAAKAANYVFGSIEWTDGNHRVRSPVVATTKCAP